MLIPRETSVEVENLNEFFYFFLLLYSLVWYSVLRFGFAYSNMLIDRKVEVERMLCRQLVSMFGSIQHLQL